MTPVFFDDSHFHKILIDLFLFFNNHLFYPNIDSEQGGNLMKSKNVIYLIVAASALGLLFQNCQGTTFKNMETSDRDAQLRELSSAGINNSISDNGSSVAESSSIVESNSTSDKLALKVVHSTSPSTQSDCSQPDARISTVISNVGSDILVCGEYVLDLPAGNPRHGTSFTCRNQDFVLPPANWTYNQSQRQWTASEAVSNSNYLVPGSYVVVVKDNQGKIYRSTPAIIKRAGYNDCLVSSKSASSSGSTATTAKRCNWSGGIVIGPTPNYAIATNQICQLGTETYSHIDSSGSTHNYRCICQ